MGAVEIYLIDPRKRIVTPVTYDGNIETMYKLLGHNCNEFQAIVLNHRRDMLYIDANARTPMGWANYDTRLDIWRHKRYHTPLIGRGLVIGCDSDGNSVAPTCERDHIAHEIRWRPQ